MKVKKALLPWASSGHAIVNGRDEGFTKRLFYDSLEAHVHDRFLGDGMVGEIVCAIEMGADTGQISQPRWAKASA